MYVLYVSMFVLSAPFCELKAIHWQACSNTIGADVCDDEIEAVLYYY